MYFVSYIINHPIAYSVANYMEYHVDGDTGPLIGFMTDESKQEAKKLMEESGFYKKVTGKPTLDLIDDVVEKTVMTMTR